MRPTFGSRRGASGMLLAGVLLGLALPGAPPPRPVGCATPREAAARDGHSTVVRCGEAPARSAGIGPLVRGPARILFGIPLDLGTVDAATLEVLPGVGPARAAAIVRERDAAPFASPADLARVPGVGARGAARLAPWFDTAAR